MENKIKIEEIIKASGLAEEDKKLWSVFLKILPNQEVEHILEALEERASNLDFLTKNLKSKIQTALRKDNSNWNQIINKEEVFLKEY